MNTPTISPEVQTVIDDYTAHIDATGKCRILVITGTGKTTIARTIAGDVEPLSGRTTSRNMIARHATSGTPVIVLDDTEWTADILSFTTDLANGKWITVSITPHISTLSSPTVKAVVITSEHAPNADLMALVDHLHLDPAGATYTPARR